MDMKESELKGEAMGSNSHINSHRTATNWIISSGSIVGAVCFESSNSFTPDEDDAEDQNSHASPAKAPVVLFPPSPDSDPCEILITFPQKHEVRQVYVRSTARVYEIYCAKKQHLSSEYLCTVRCGIATRDEEVLQAPPIEEACLGNSKEHVSDPEVRRSRNDENVGKNEDDWVKVKTSDSSLPSKGGNMPVSSKGSTQDLYEATAEINDAEPCTCITIRLLSLQDKGCLFIDEVYIFADPVELTDSENEVGGAVSSASSSLMAMFMPTLLQLSSAKGSSWVKDKQISDEVEKKTAQESLRNTNGKAETPNEVRQEMQKHMNLPEAGVETAKPAQPETSTRACGLELRPNLPSNQVVNVLQQLVSRVGRLEEVLFRFEERLLTPIYSIDVRLQRVENKLEELSTINQNSSARVVAPEFAYSDSDPNSFCTSLSKSHDPKPNGVNETVQSELPSCTRISALDVSCGEEETSASNPTENSVDRRGDHYSGLTTEKVPLKIESSSDEEDNKSLADESLEDKPKPSLSITDALASALAGFLSSTQPVEKTYTQALVVKAPEFCNEEDCNDTDNEEITDAPTVENLNSPACSGAEESLNDSASSSSCNLYTENETENVRFTEHDSKVSKEVDERSHDSKRDDSTVTKSYSDSCREIIEDGITTNLTLNMSDNADDPDMSMQKGVLNSGFVASSTEVKETPEIHDVLRSVLGFLHSSSSVDFEIPILDVKFNSQKASIDKSSIDAFFGSSSKSDAGSVASDVYIRDSNRCNLISVDDCELAGPPTDTLASFDMNYFDISDADLNLEGERREDHDGSIEEEIHEKDLIYEKSLV